MRLTALGSMKLSFKEWNDKPALIGTYQIDTRMSNGSLGPVDDRGNNTSLGAATGLIRLVSLTPEAFVMNDQLNVFQTDDKDLQEME